MYNEKENNGFKVDVLGCWEGKAIPKENIMNLADRFCHFVPLENIEISESRFGFEKWNLVSKKAYAINTTLKTINEYHKKHQINNSIIDAFCTLMGHNIILLKVNGFKYICISNHDTSPS